MKRSKDLLTNAKNILKELESKVDKQKNVYNRIVSKEKLLTAKLKDIDYDILRIINVCDVGIIKDKVLEYREELSQKQRECEIQSDILKNLRETVKMNTMAIFEKEEELRDLTKTMNDLKEGSLKTIKGGERPENF